MPTAGELSLLIKARDQTTQAFNQVSSNVLRLRGYTMGLQNAVLGMSRDLRTLVVMELAKWAAAAVRAIGQAMDYALDKAKEWEMNMAVLGKAAKSQGEPLGKLEELTKRIGYDMDFMGVSSNTAAEGLIILYKAGLTSNQIMGDMEGYLKGTAKATGAFRAAVNLAAASELSMGQSAEFVATQMFTFAESGETAEQMVDHLVKTADASKTSVEELARAYENVGSTAAYFGLKQSDVNILLALLSRYAIEGSKAGTAIRTMLNYMIRPTDAVTEALQFLNIQLYDSTGKMKPMEKIIALLGDRLFGTYDAMVKVGGATKEQEKAWKALETKIKNAEQAIREYQAGARGLSSSEKTRGVRIDELNNKINLFRQQQAELGITEGKLVQITRTLTEEQRQLILSQLFGIRGQVAAAAGAREGAKGWEEQKAQIEASADAFEIAEARYWTLTGALDEFRKVIDTLAVESLADALEPLADTVRTVSRLIKDNKDVAIDWFHSWIEYLGSKLPSAIDNTILGIKAFYHYLTGDWDEAWTSIYPPWFALQMKEMGEFDWMKVLPPWLAKALTKIGAAARKSWAQIKKYFRLFLDFAKEKAIPWIVENLDRLEAALKGILTLIGVVTLVGRIVTLLSLLTNPITLLIALAGLLGVAWHENWFGIRDTLTGVWEEMRPKLFELWEWLQENIPIAITTVTTWFTEKFLPALHSVWAYLEAHVFPVLKELWDWFKSWLPPVLEKLGTLITEKVLPDLLELGDWFVKNILPSLVDFVKWVGDKVPAALDFLIEHWDEIKKLFVVLLALFLLGKLGVGLTTLLTDTGGALKVLGVVLGDTVGGLKAGGGLATFTGLAEALGKVSKNAGGAYLAATLLKPILAAMGSPIFWLVVLIGLLALAWVEDFAGIRTFMEEWYYRDMEPLFKKIADWLQNKLTFKPSPELQQAWEETKPAYEEWQRGTDAYRQAIENWFQNRPKPREAYTQEEFLVALQRKWDEFVLWLNGLGPRLAAGWEEIRGTFASVFEANVFEVAWDYLKKFYAWLIGPFLHPWKVLYGFLGNVWNKLAEVRGYVVTALAPTWQSLGETFGGLGERFREVWETVTDWFKEKWEQVSEWFRTKIDSIKEWWEGVKEAAAGVLDLNVFEVAWELLKGFGLWLKDTLVGFIMAPITQFETLWTWIKKIADRVYEWLKPALETFGIEAENLDEALAMLWDTIKVKLEPVLNWLSTKATEIKEALAAAAQFIKDTAIGAWEELKEALDPVWQVLSDIATMIRETLLGAWEDLKGGFLIMEEQAGKVAAALGEEGLLGSFNSFVTSIKNFLVVEVWGALKAGFQWLIDNLPWLSGLVDTLAAALSRVKASKDTRGGSPPPLAYWLMDIAAAAKDCAIFIKQMADALSKELGSKTLKAMKNIYDTVSLFKKLADALRDIGRAPEVTDFGAWAQPMVDVITTIVNVLNTARYVLGDKAIKTAKKLVEPITTILSVIESLVTAIKALSARGLRPLSIERIVSFITNLHDIAKAFVEGTLDLVLAKSAVYEAATFAKDATTIMEFLEAAVSAMEVMAEWDRTVPADAVIEALVETMNRIIAALADAMGTWRVEGLHLDDVGDFVEELQRIVPIIEPAIDAITALAAFEGGLVPEEVIQTIVDNIMAIATRLADAFAVWVAKEYDEADVAAWSQSMQQIVGLIEPGIEAIKALQDIIELGYWDILGAAAAMGRFSIIMEFVFEQLYSLYKLWEGRPLDEAARWSENATTMVGLVGAGVEAIKALYEIIEYSYWDILGLAGAMAVFHTVISFVLEQLRMVWQSFAETPITEEAAEFASNAAELVGLVGAGIEAITALKDYEFDPYLWIKVEAWRLNMFTLIAELDLLYMILDDYVSEEGAKWASEAAEMVAIVGAGVDAINSLGEYEPLVDASRTIERYEQDLALIIVMLETMAKVLADYVSEEAGQWASNASDMVSIISAGVDAIASLGEYRPFKGDLWATLVMWHNDVNMVVRMARTLLLQLESLVTEEMAQLAGWVSELVGLVEPSIEALDALSGYAGTVGLAESMTVFSADILEMVKELSSIIGDLGAFVSAEAAELAGYIQEIVGIVKPGVDALVELSGYTAAVNLTTKAAEFRADMITALTELAAISGAFGTDEMSALAQFSTDLSMAMNSIQTGVQALVDLANWQRAWNISTKAKWLTEDLHTVLKELYLLWQGWPAEIVSAMAEFAEGLAKVATIMGEIMEDLVTIAYYNVPKMKEGLDHFKKDMGLIIATLSDISETVGTDAVEEASKFAFYLSMVLGFIQTAMTQALGLEEAYGGKGIVWTFATRLVSAVAFAARNLMYVLDDLLGYLTAVLLGPGEFVEKWESAWTRIANAILPAVYNLRAFGDLAGGLVAPTMNAAPMGGTYGGQISGLSFRDMQTLGQLQMAPTNRKLDTMIKLLDRVANAAESPSLNEPTYIERTQLNQLYGGR